MKHLVMLIGPKWENMETAGIIAVVVVAQIIIKVVIDTINFPNSPRPTRTFRGCSCWSMELAKSPYE